MGREVVKVPKGFSHPVDWCGDPVPGGHLELLYEVPDGELICFQIYETCSEGTPVSPVFASETEMCAWLVARGCAAEEAARFAATGSAPTFFVTHDGRVEKGVTEATWSSGGMGEKRKPWWKFW